MTNAERNAEIIRRRKAGVGPRQIARDMGLTGSVVAGVLGRAGLTDSASRYSHKTKRPGCGGNNAVLNETAVLVMRAVHERGSRKYGVAAIARRYDVAETTARQAIKGKTWAHVQ
jgi:hypothetical protein